MTRKHFQALAKALHKLKLDSIDRSGPNMVECSFDDVANCIANVCETHNPNFDRARFIEACNG